MIFYRLSFINQTICHEFREKKAPSEQTKQACTTTSKWYVNILIVIFILNSIIVLIIVNLFSIQL